MPARKLLTTLAVVLFLATGALADETFVRLAEDGPNAALQTAYATYTRDGSDVQIVLYGVVHIGEAAYYERVQQDLDSYDVVLWEGVKPEDPSKVDESAANLGKLQQTMGELLGLTFQKDGIDYTRKNLVHADMTWEQFQAALGDGKEGGLSPFGNFIDAETLEKMAPMIEMAARIGKAFMEGNPEMRDNFKLQMARQLGGDIDLGAQLGEKVAQVILEERNKVAMKVLETELDKRQSGSIAIFYGAAHMPDFEARLAAMGYHRTDKRWVSAWQIRKGIESDPADGPAAPKAAPAPSQDKEKVWYE